MAQKILIVEDEHGVVHLLKSRLEADGFQVIAAYNGQEGLRAVTEARPDLVILDLTLPDLDGFELCRRLREFDQHTPILFFAGAAYETDKRKAVAAGANAYIVKPDSGGVLVGTVLQLIAHR